MSRTKSVVDSIGRVHSVSADRAEGLQLIFDAIGNDHDRARYLLLAMEVVTSIDDADARSSALLGEVMLHMPWLEDLALRGCEAWRAS